MTKSDAVAVKNNSLRIIRGITKLAIALGLCADLFFLFFHGEFMAFICTAMAILWRIFSIVFVHIFDLLMSGYKRWRLSPFEYYGWLLLPSPALAAPAAFYCSFIWAAGVGLLLPGIITLPSSNASVSEQASSTTTAQSLANINGPAPAPKDVNNILRWIDDFERLDIDRSGFLEQNEHRAIISLIGDGFDLNNDNKIDRDEYLVYMQGN